MKFSAQAATHLGLSRDDEVSLPFSGVVWLSLLVARRSLGGVVVAASHLLFSGGCGCLCAMYSVVMCLSCVVLYGKNSCPTFIKVPLY